MMFRIAFCNGAESLMSKWRAVFAVPENDAAVGREVGANAPDGRQKLGELEPYVPHFVFKDFRVHL